jgi:nucleoside-diphosphate-sugar epimerase
VRIVVIGGSGHVGTFLVPRLVRAGHEVINLTRGVRAPYIDDEVWSDVEQVAVDRAAEDAAGTFGQRVAALEADVVVDMICFTPDSAAALVKELRGHSGHLIHCGTIWRYGPSVKQPMREDDTSPPIGEYGTQKAAIAELLAAETAAGGLVTTVLQPGHISGPGWTPIGPLGNLDPAVWYALSAGQEIAVPGLGAELMHHVHADDVAQAFQLAVEHRDAAAGESFNVVAPSALTARGFLAIAAGVVAITPECVSSIKRPLPSSWPATTWLIIIGHFAAIVSCTVAPPALPISKWFSCIMRGSSFVQPMIFIG